MNQTANRIAETSRHLLLALALLILTPTDALAYLDPGTGSYLFQLAAASFLAGAYTLRRYWWALASRFRRARGRTSSPAAEQTNGVE